MRSWATVHILACYSNAHRQAQRAVYNNKVMSFNPDRLVSSEQNYDSLIRETIETIKKDRDQDQTLKKVILFCKSTLSVKHVQRKKYLCLHLIKDISESVKSPYFEKILDENIPIKLLKTITYEVGSQARDSRHQDDEYDYSDRLLRFAVETISFWTKKLSLQMGRPQFADVAEDLRKMKIELPRSYEYYRPDRLSVALWEKEENSEEFVKNEEMSPLIAELFEKFAECKGLIEEKINEAVLNEEEIYLKAVIEKLREFLLVFFNKYKQLESETSLDRDVLVVYYHIINVLFKRISNRFYLPHTDMIALTKEVFEGNHPSDFSSVDRMDIVHLAGIHKYNALHIFQRVHSRIEAQEAKLGPCELTFEQKDLLAYANKRDSNRKDGDKAPKFKR